MLDKKTLNSNKQILENLLPEYYYSSQQIFCPNKSGIKFVKRRDRDYHWDGESIIIGTDITSVYAGYLYGFFEFNADGDSGALLLSRGDYQLLIDAGCDFRIIYDVHIANDVRTEARWFDDYSIYDWVDGFTQGTPDAVNDAFAIEKLIDIANSLYMTNAFMKIPNDDGDHNDGWSSSTQYDDSKIFRYNDCRHFLNALTVFASENEKRDYVLPSEDIVNETCPSNIRNFALDTTSRNVNVKESNLISDASIEFYRSLVKKWMEKTSQSPFALKLPNESLASAEETKRLLDDFARILQ